jgi:hypothetical protein
MSMVFGGVNGVHQYRGLYGMGVGKHIRGGFVLYEVGDNTRTWFWHDLWCGDNLSKDAYSELLHIATYQKKEEKNCFTLLLIEAQRW